MSKREALHGKTKCGVDAAADDGVNYRHIAGTMTILGHPMNHSSARNYTLRVMRKFARALAKHWDVNMKDSEKLDAIARSPLFQSGIAEVLKKLWHESSARAILIVDETEANVAEPAPSSEHDAGSVHR